jgi:hypothetical protein
MTNNSEKLPALEYAGLQITGCVPVEISAESPAVALRANKGEIIFWIFGNSENPNS